MATETEEIYALISELLNKYPSFSSQQVIELAKMITYSKISNDWLESPIGSSMPLIISSASSIGTNTPTSSPIISGSATHSVEENQTATGSYVITNRNGEAPTLTGADAALMSIILDSGDTYNLVFDSAPDFEAPGDVGANNVYNVTINIDNLVEDAVTLAVATTVTNVVEGSSPANPAVSVNTENPYCSVIITCDVVSTAVIYTAQKSADGSTGWENVGTNGYAFSPNIGGATITMEDTTLVPGEQRYYRIKARLAAGTDTGWSTVVNATATALPTLVAPGSYTPGDSIVISPGTGQIAAAYAAWSTGQGGVIILEPGTYNETTINWSKDGASASDRLIMMTRPGEVKATIVGPVTSSTDEFLNLQSSGVNYATFSGFEIDEFNNAQIRMRTMTDVLFNDISSSDSPSNADNAGFFKYYQGTQTRVKIQNCDVTQDEIIIKGDLGTMRDCTFRWNRYAGCVWAGVQIKYQDDSVVATQIIDYGSIFDSNTVSFMWNCSFVDLHNALILGGGGRLQISNPNGGTNAPGDITVDHCTHIDGEIAITPAATDFVVSQCFVLNLSFTGSNSGNVTYSGNYDDVSDSATTADFVDYAGGDYNIDAGSSAYRAAADGRDMGAFIPGCGPQSGYS